MLMHLVVHTVNHVIIDCIDLSGDEYMKPAAMPMSKDGKPPDRKFSTSDNKVVIQDTTIKDKSYQAESIMDPSLL